MSSLAFRFLETWAAAFLVDNIYLMFGSYPIRVFGATTGVDHDVDHSGRVRRLHPGVRLLTAPAGCTSPPSSPTALRSSGCCGSSRATRSGASKCGTTKALVAKHARCSSLPTVESRGRSVSAIGPRLVDELAGTAGGAASDGPCGHCVVGGVSSTRADSAVSCAQCASQSTSDSTTSSATAPNRTTPGQLSLLVEPDQGMAPIYALIASARKSIDLTMYELVDTGADLALELAAGRGVNVRVLLDVNREKAANQAAFTELTDMRVHVAWADTRYAATHQKTLVVDGSVAAVMTLNMTSRYYSSTRDFAVVDRNPRDVAAIEQVFNADFTHARSPHRRPPTSCGARINRSPHCSR